MGSDVVPDAASQLPTGTFLLSAKAIALSVRRSAFWTSSFSRARSVGLDGDQLHVVGAAVGHQHAEGAAEFAGLRQDVALARHDRAEDGLLVVAEDTDGGLPGLRHDRAERREELGGAAVRLGAGGGGGEHAQEQGGYQASGGHVLQLPVMTEERGGWMGAAWPPE